MSTLVAEARKQSVELAREGVNGTPNLLNMLADALEAAEAEKERLRSYAIGIPACDEHEGFGYDDYPVCVEDERKTIRNRCEQMDTLVKELESSRHDLVIQVGALEARCERMEGLIRRRFPGLMTAMMEWQLDQDMLALLTELDAAKEPNRE